MNWPNYRHKTPRTAIEKGRLTARLYSDPKRCERCQQFVAREAGGYRNLKTGRRVWWCLSHEEKKS